MKDVFLKLSKAEVGIIKTLNSVHKTSNYQPWKIVGHRGYFVHKSFLSDDNCPEDFKAFFSTLKEKKIIKAQIKLADWKDIKTHKAEATIRAAYDPYTPNQLPKHLYHYTDSNGLLGITYSKTLWATHYGCLNDYNEFEYAKALIRNAIENKMGESEIDQAVKKNWRHFEDQFKYLDIFLTSFSTKSDRLSQWRGYSNNGKGYSLGFRTEAMALATPPKIRSSSFTIRPVLYDLKEQNKHINDAIQNTQSKLMLSKENFKSPGHYSLEFYKALHWIALLPIVTFKSPHFEEEHEWRAIVIQPPHDTISTPGLDVNFRNSNGQVIPYVELDVNSEVGDSNQRFPLRNITYGPAINPDIADISLPMLKREYLSSNVKIVQSKLTLRGM